jgi:hypothetical protein
MRSLFICFPSMLCVLLVSVANMAYGGVSLTVDQSSLVNIGGNNWSINLLTQLMQEDLTSPPKISSVNVRLFFSPTAPGLNFVDTVAPVSAPIFSAGSPTYNSGSPDLNSEIFASAISSSASSDPFLSNNGNFFTVRFSASPSLIGVFGINIDPSLDAGTFFTRNGGGGTPVAFDSVTNGSFTAVPEPSSLAPTLVLSLFAVLYARRKRLQKKPVLVTANAGTT